MGAIPEGGDMQGKSSSFSGKTIQELSLQYNIAQESKWKRNVQHLEFLKTKAKKSGTEKCSVSYLLDR